MMMRPVSRESSPMVERPINHTGNYNGTSNPTMTMMMRAGSSGGLRSHSKPQTSTSSTPQQQQPTDVMQLALTGGTGFQLDPFTESIVRENEAMLVEVEYLRGKSRELVDENAKLSKKQNDMEQLVAQLQKENAGLRHDMHARASDVGRRDAEHAALRQQLADLQKEYDVVVGTMEKETSTIRRGFQGNSGVTRVEMLTAQLEQLLKESRHLCSTVQTVAYSLRRCHVQNGTKSDAIPAIVAKHCGMLHKLRDSARRSFAPSSSNSSSINSSAALTAAGSSSSSSDAAESTAVVAVIRTMVWDALDAGIFATEENLRAIAANAEGYAHAQQRQGSHSSSH